MRNFNKIRNVAPGAPNHRNARTDQRQREAQRQNSDEKSPPESRKNATQIQEHDHESFNRGRQLD
jgi:hypothetical protein